VLGACDQNPIERVDFELGRASAGDVAEQPLRHPTLAFGMRAILARQRQWQHRED